MTKPKPKTEQQPTRQIISRERVAAHGEVFTAPREVNAMLDLVKQETERIESRFLEPACGQGAFLTEILRRKLAVVTQRYRAVQSDWERYAVLAVSSIYGIEILPDNAATAIGILLDIFAEHYRLLYKSACNEAVIDTTHYILTQNIVCGDALTMQTVGEHPEPIVMPEWSFVSDSRIVRRDFKYDMLTRCAPVEGPNLFSDLGEQAFIPEPVREYPPENYLNLAKRL